MLGWWLQNHPRWGRILASKSVTFHVSEAGALAMGIQYVNECLLTVAALPSKALRYRQ
jgi:hypothetical protein